MSCYYFGRRGSCGQCDSCRRGPGGALQHIACGDINAGALVVLCACGLLKQSDRPHSYDRNEERAPDAVRTPQLGATGEEDAPVTPGRYADY